LDAIFHVELACGRYCNLYFLFIISRTSMILKAQDIRFTTGKNPNQVTRWVFFFTARHGTKSTMKSIPGTVAAIIFNVMRGNTTQITIPPFLLSLPAILPSIPWYIQHLFFSGSNSLSLLPVLHLLHLP